MIWHISMVPRVDETVQHATESESPLVFKVESPRTDPTYMHFNKKMSELRPSNS